MRSRLFFGLLFLFSGTLAYADTSGFAQDSVWLSRTPITEGQTVTIYAALRNSSAATLTGTVVFKDAATRIGAIPLSLSAGESQIVSISWTPTAGGHSITAELIDTSFPTDAPKGTLSVSVITKAETEDKKSSSSQTASAADFTDSADIQQALTSVSPSVTAVVTPLLEKIDSVRASGTEFLSDKVAETKGKVEGISTQRDALVRQDTPEAQKENRSLGLQQMLHTGLLYLFETLRTVLAKAILFYPLFGFLFLFGLWKLYQRMRRPSYSY